MFTLRNLLRFFRNFYKQKVKENNKYFSENIQLIDLNYSENFERRLGAL